MKRRKFVIGLGSIAAGSAALGGSGAFSVARMDRQVDADVVTDSDAEIALVPDSLHDDTDMVRLNEDGELEISFPNGVNINSFYSLGTPRDNRDDWEDLLHTGGERTFRIKNNHDQDREIELEYNVDSELNENGSKLGIGGRSSEEHDGKYGTQVQNDWAAAENGGQISLSWDIPPGELVVVDMAIDTTREGASTDEDLGGTMTITATDVS